MRDEPSARKVVTRSPRRNVGIINCRWFQNVPIEYESQLEKRFVYSTMLCPGVRQIRSQPFTMTLGKCKYTPDFLVDFGYMKVVVEIKPASKVERYSARFDLAAEQLANRGVAFYVVTDAGIDRGYYARVAEQVIRYARSEIPEQEVRRALDTVAPDAELSLADIQERAQVSRQVVLHMLAWRRLRIHPDDLIEDFARVSRCQLTPALDLTAFEQRFVAKPWTHSGLSLPPPTPRPKGLKKRATTPSGPYLRESTASRVPAEPSPLSLMASGL